MVNVDHHSSMAYRRRGWRRKRATHHRRGEVCAGSPGSSGPEFAIAVADQWQSRGVGAAIARRLLDHAREQGIHHLDARILATNSRMLGLARLARIQHRLESGRVPHAGRTAKKVRQTRIQNANPDQYRPQHPRLRVRGCVGSLPRSRTRCERFSAHITRVEVHLGDENAGKRGSDDKRCMMEARLEGHPASRGDAPRRNSRAGDRRCRGEVGWHRIERTLGRLHSHRGNGATPIGAEQGCFRPARWRASRLTVTANIQ